MKDLIKIDNQIDKLSKKELLDLGAEDAVRVMEAGQESPLRLHIRAKRLLEYIKSVFDTTKGEAQIEFSTHGEKTVKLWEADVTSVNGSDIPDYSQDMVYADLKAKLAERKALLDLRFKSDNEIYDEDGALVPKVLTGSSRRDSLHIKF